MKMSRCLDLLIILSFIVQGSSFRLGNYMNSRHERAPDENDENSTEIHRGTLAMELSREINVTERTDDDKKKELEPSEKKDSVNCILMYGGKTQLKYVCAIGKNFSVSWNKKRRQFRETSAKRVSYPTLKNVINRIKGLWEHSVQKLKKFIRAKRGWTLDDDVEEPASQNDPQPTGETEDEGSSSPEKTPEEEEKKEEEKKEEEKKEENEVTEATSEIIENAGTTMTAVAEEDKIDKFDDKIIEKEEEKVVTTTKPDAANEKVDESKDKNDEKGEEEKFVDRQETEANEYEEVNYEENEEEREDDATTLDEDNLDAMDEDNLDAMDEGNEYADQAVDGEDDENFPDPEEPDYGNEEADGDIDDTGEPDIGDDAEANYKELDEGELQEGMPDAAEEDFDDNGETFETNDEGFNEDEQNEKMEGEEEMEREEEEYNDEGQGLEEGEFDEEKGEEDSDDEDDGDDQRPSNDLETESAYVSIISPEGIWNFFVGIKDLLAETGDYILSLIFRDMKHSLRKHHIDEKFEKHLNMLANSRQVNSKKALKILLKKIRREFGRSYELQLVTFLKQLRDNFKS